MWAKNLHYLFALFCAFHTGLISKFYIFFLDLWSNVLTTEITKSIVLSELFLHLPFSFTSTLPSSKSTIWFLTLTNLMIKLHIFLSLILICASMNMLFKKYTFLMSALYYITLKYLDIRNDSV